MICDDHDGTDDWFMTGKICADTLANPFGRALVRNALASFSVCQGWGNDPALWSYQAHRGLLPLEDLPDGHVLVVVSPAPVLGPPVLNEIGGTILQSKHDVVDIGWSDARRAKDGAVTGMEVGTPLGVQYYDAEHWGLHEAAFERLLERMSHYERVVVLGGDVHYGAAYEMDWTGVDANPAGARRARREHREHGEPPAARARAVPRHAGDPLLGVRGRRRPAPQPLGRVRRAPHRRADPRAGLARRARLRPADVRAEHWIPLLAVADPSGAAGSGPIVLQRGSLLTQDATARPITAQGELLAPGVRPWFIREAEVPRAGVRIQRIPAVARWLDGTTHAWLSRRVGSGAGEGSSGLRFDLGVPPAQE